MAKPPKAGSDHDQALDASSLDAGTREHYRDAELYDYEYRTRRGDVRFYRALADELLGASGSILEMCCGTGRITKGLLRGGHSVVGLDLAPAMLRLAHARVARLGRAHRHRCALIRADVRDFSLSRRFPMIIMGFNSFEHLYTGADVSACLERVREHLLPGGCFAFDVQNPDLAWLCRDPHRRWARTKFRHPATRDPMIYSTNHDYDPITQILRIRLYYENVSQGATRSTTKIVKLAQRKFFPAELETTMAANGFLVERRYGDFDFAPISGSCENQVLVCRPQR